MNTVESIFVLLVLMPVFSLAAVVIWLRARLKEREAQYRSETLKRLTEAQGGEKALEYLREETRLLERRMREGLKLGGLVTLAVGVGLMIFLAAVIRYSPVYLVGLIPLLLGASLLVYVLLLAPKE